MHPAMVGTTTHHSQADNFRRKYHVWAVFDPLTHELESIYVNSSSDFMSAEGPLLRKQCVAPYQLHAWAFAEERLAADLIADRSDEADDESAVIEPLASTVGLFGVHRGH